MGIFKSFKKQQQKLRIMCNVSVKVGDIVKVTGNSNSHNYKIGSEYVVLEVFETTECVRASHHNGNWIGNHLKIKDFVIVSGLTRDRITKELNEYKAKAAELQSRLDWMDEMGTDEYDDAQHKVWSVMNALENQSLSKLEKVELITSIVKK